jgi:tRNA(Phe) wybutosine-synthesizing methylase Tyw3
MDESPNGYKPTNQQLLQQHEVRLQFLSRGCIIHVGCKSIAFESVEAAIKELNYYVTNTCESQKAWNIVLGNQ